MTDYTHLYLHTTRHAELVRNAAESRLAREALASRTRARANSLWQRIVGTFREPVATVVQAGLVRQAPCRCCLRGRRCTGCRCWRSWRSGSTSTGSSTTPPR